MGPNSCPIEFEQVLGQAAALEDRAHEREERDRQQELVRDDAVELVGQVAEEVRANETELDADEAEEQAGRGQRERRRIADQHEQDHAPEHQRRHVVAHEGDHCSGFSYLKSASITCSSAAMRLMISEIPCSAIKKKPTGSIELDRPAQQAAGVGRDFTDPPGFDEPRPGEVGQDHADRQQEQKAADDVDPDPRAFRDHAVDEVDAHVLVHLERIGGAEQHHAGEHVPLDFEPGVRARAEQVAAGRIARADQAGEQHQPVGNHAEFRVQPVDTPAEHQ